MKIKEYLIGTIPNLNCLLEQGYEPYGNPLSHDGSFMQAMVKYAENKTGADIANEFNKKYYDIDPPVFPDYEKKYYELKDSINIKIL